MYTKYDVSARLEMIISAGEIVIPKEDVAVDFTREDITWDISVKCIGDDKNFVPLELRNISMSEYADTSKNILDMSLYAGPISTATQSGRWGDSGSLKVGPFDKIDLSGIKSVTKDDVTGDHIIKYSILTTIAYCQRETVGGNLGWGFIVSGDKIKFNIGIKSISIKDSDTQVTVGDVSKGQPTKLESNTLIQPHTTINSHSIATNNANKVLDDWQEGKESVEIDVMQGEYYDAAGKKVLSTSDTNYPMFFEVGQMVIPFVSESEEFYDGEKTYIKIKEVPLSKYDDGVAKRFNIYDISQTNDGIGFQRLKLLESSLRKKLTVTKEDNEKLVLDRRSSPLANAELGILQDDTQVIYLDDLIMISGSGPIGTYQIIYLNNMFLENRAYKVDSNWDITIKSVTVNSYNLTINSDTPQFLSVKRVKSNAPLGILDNNSIVYEKDILQVNASEVSSLVIAVNGEVVGQYMPELGVTTYFKEFEVTGDVVITFKARTETVILENVSTTLSYRADGSFVNNTVSAPLAVVGDKSQTFGTQIKLTYYSSLSGSSSIFEQFVETNYPITFLIDTTGGFAGVMYGNYEELEPFIDNAMAVLTVEVTENGVVNFKNQSKDGGMTRFSRVEVKYMYQLS